jgi:hypothetical protein
VCKEVGWFLVQRVGGGCDADADGMVVVQRDRMGVVQRWWGGRGAEDWVMVVVQNG